jgi:glutathione S-transferase
MIEVWGRNNAYNVQKVIWVLHELNLEYRHHDVGSTPGDLDSEDFRSKNLHSRIPVLLDQDEYIWESNTIVRYLAYRYSKGVLWQQSPKLRSRAERWMDWELATLQPDFIELFWGYYRTPESECDHLKISASLKRCELHFSQLNQHLKTCPYLAGESFTMGDIPCATSLYRYFSMGLNVEQPKYVLDWYKRLSEREAFQDTIMVSFDELRGRVEF